MPFNGATPACKRACLFRDRFTGGRELIRSPSGFPCSSGLKLRFPSNRAFPVPAPEKLQEKTEGFLSCAERAVPRIFLFLGMEVSPEFEKLLQDGLRDVFSIRPACLFSIAFPWPEHAPVKSRVPNPYCREMFFPTSSRTLHCGILGSRKGADKETGKEKFTWKPEQQREIRSRGDAIFPSMTAFRNLAH